MMPNALADLSQSISQLVAATANVLSAIRIGPNRHMTGLVYAGDVIVTTDQELPALDSYTVVLPHGHLVGARPGPRDPGCNLSVLRLEAPFPVVNAEMANASVGSVAVVVGADADASPTVRLTVIHRIVHTADGPTPVLDLPGDGLKAGSLVLDADGRLIGLAAAGSRGEAAVIRATTISRIIDAARSLDGSHQSLNAALSGNRGWLGVALQPITVPDAIVARAGQSSGRMIVSITKDGPAQQAGLRVGDVLLALNGTSASGPHALRAFLDIERIGSTVEVKLLREGNLATAYLTVAARPG